MKHCLIGLLLALLTIGSPVSAKKIRPSDNAFRVVLLQSSKNSATVRSIGNGTSEAQCQEDAQVKAVKAVLFVGLTSADATRKQQALVDPALESDAYFTSFFNDKQYKRFIAGSGASSSMDKVKGQKFKEQAFDIVLNIDALQRQLRNDKIIKRMGLQ